jgi:hypothetical protein
MAQLLTESGSAPQKVGNLWKAVLITPGKGSSGIYTEETLRDYGPAAFAKGTHSYVDHPRSEDDVRSPKNIIGVLAEDARYEDGVGLVAELEIMPHWKEFVEAVAPHTGLSIYAMGEGSYNEEGDMEVESLVPNVQNSVDLVSYPGRPGSKLADKLYEAAVAMVAEADVDESYHGGSSAKPCPPGKVRRNGKCVKERLTEEEEVVAERDIVEWDYQGRELYGQVAYVMTSGVFPFEGDPLAISASEESPVALIRVWEKDESGEWQPTDMLMGSRTSELTKVSTLGESKSGIRGTAAKTAAATESKKKEEYMELKELSDQIAELPNLVAAAVAEALAPEVETEDVDVAAVAEAMVEANLPEVSRKAVYESLRAGGDLAEAIESQKAFVESVKSHFKEEATASAKNVEETVIVNTEEKALTLSEILNVKVGA